MPEPQKDKLTAKQKRMWSDYHQSQHAAAQTVKPSIIAIDSVESIYKALNDQDEIKGKALLMLMLRNWLTEVSNFDPVSGHALHTGIIDFMDAVAKSVQDESPESEIKDRIYRIVSHTKEAVLAIMKHTRDKILREHAMLPIHAAREVDSNSVQWLSRQPGRTLREKLSGKPYIKAVRRRSSVDTAENRLLKAFLCRLEQILIERQNALAAPTEKACEKLLVSLQRWLSSEDASEIGPWGNLPPNNTLLQDKRYRKAWDGWLWFQAIDEQITGDSKRVHRDILSVIYWNTLSLLNHSGRFRTVQQPVGLDYDNFAISPELPVRGYLFPDNSNTKLVGTVDKLVTERRFGFIDGCFFHASDLDAGLRFDDLQIGDQLQFDAEETSKGKCAKRLKKGVHALPKHLMFELLNEQIDIGVNEEIISIRVENGHVILTQQNKNINNKLRIEPTDLRVIPKTILSLVTDSPFEFSEPTNNQSGPIRIDNSVVDLCSIRPMFATNTGSQAYLPFRLLQQTWKLKDGTKQVIDCSDAKAVILNPDIETVSMRSLFSHSGALPDATKSSASMFFTKKLSDYITADKLTYLIPDWGNDFDLEGIRKSVNFYFDESTPLPKSIAAIFAWQTSADFEGVELNNKSEILVVDSFYGGFSVTPITVQFSEKLKEKLPKTKGITWERHPIFLIENNKILKEVVDKLGAAKCPFPEDVIQLFGLDGLFQDAGNLTLEKDAKPFHISYNIIDVLQVKGNLISSDNTNELRDYLKKKDVENTFILPLSQSVILDPLLEKYKCLAVKEGASLTEGALTLEKWQKDIDDLDIALWRDHLPEL
jgi:cold shock CspA family protein